MDEIITDINIEVDIPEKEMLKGFTDFIVGEHYRVVTCVKLLSKWKNYKDNIEFWVSSGFFILLIELFIVIYYSF